MKIHTNNAKYNFNGWDARKLRALVMTNPGYKSRIAQELQQIGDKTGFDVFVLTQDKLVCAKQIKLQKPTHTVKNFIPIKSVVIIFF